MPKEHHIVGLDIGTQNLRVIQAKVDEATGSLSVIGASSVPASGMRKGVIVDIEETVSSISAVLEKVERMTGVPVTHANISVGGNHITCLESKGVIAVSRADGEITENDVIRVIDASQAISIPPNREVIHVIPKTFTLDGQTGIKDPVGMTGIRLEVETIIIHGALPFLKNLNQDELNRLLAKTLKRNPPQRLRDQKQPKVFGLNQTGTNPPHFELLVNYPAAISQPYRRYVLNQIIEQLGFWGTPVALRLKGKDKK